MGLLDAWRTTRQNIIDSKPTYSRIFPAQDYSAGVYRGNTNNPVVASDSTGNIVEQPAPITRRIIDNGGRGGDFDDNNTSFVDNDVFQALAQTGAGVRGEDYDRPNSFFESSTSFFIDSKLVYIDILVSFIIATLFLLISDNLLGSAYNPITQIFKFFALSLSGIF